MHAGGGGTTLDKLSVVVRHIRDVVCCLVLNIFVLTGLYVKVEAYLFEHIFHRSVQTVKISNCTRWTGCNSLHTVPGSFYAITVCYKILTRWTFQELNLLNLNLLLSSNGERWIHFSHNPKCTSGDTISYILRLHHLYPVLPNKSTVIQYGQIIQLTF